MEESLGAGFDRIRATVMPSSNFESSLIVSPAITQTINDLEGPAYLRLRSTDNLNRSGRFLLNEEPHATGEDSRLSISNGSEEIDLEIPHRSNDRSRSTDSETAERMPGLASLLQRINNPSTIEVHTENGRLVENCDFLRSDCLSPAIDSEDDSNDPEDMSKFYSGLHTRIGNSDDYYYDDDDMSLEDFDDDGDFEKSQLGGGLAYLSSRGIIEPEENTIDAHFSAPPTYERNLTIEQFIRLWRIQSTTTSANTLHLPQPSIEAASVSLWDRPERIIRPQRLNADFYDIQQIPWREKLCVRREDARVLRDAWYAPYRNLDYPKDGYQQRLPTHEFYFREKAMYSNLRATIEHFQLRNLVSVTASNTVHFAHESRLVSWAPAYDHVAYPIDLSQPEPEIGFQGPVKISTMRSKYGLAVAGGFNGEYGIHAEGGPTGNTYGYVTKNFNGITNHIDIIQSRTSNSPKIVFASNDQHIRILDCERNQFISDHELSKAVNCTETSADGRLRVVIGDSPEACVLEADSGSPVQRLPGHRDFGFACAWSPDMLHIATSNQDKTVNIWDVRMWRILQSIDSDRAGYRSLRFSPVGGGPRTLLMCEPADRISIVNAQTYETRQVHDFFGEIGGADYTPDGSSIWVANTDDLFGGLMEFERSQFGQRYGSASETSRKNWSSSDEFTPDWYSDLPHEWMTESELDPSPRCITNERERDFRCLDGLSNEARDNLLI